MAKKRKVTKSAAAQESYTSASALQTSTIVQYKRKCLSHDRCAEGLTDAHTPGEDRSLCSPLGDKYTGKGWSLPLPTQHRLFSYVQQILEEMCREFGQKHFPAQMLQRQWLEPNSLELTSWTRFLRKRNIPSTPTPTPFLPIDEKALSRMMSSVAQIRHHAVHRRSSSVQFMTTCLQDAVMFDEWHQQSLVVVQLGSILQGYRDILEQSRAEEQRLSADLQTSITLIETVERKRKERVNAVFKQQREAIRAQVGGLVADLIPEPSSTSQLKKNERQTSEDAVTSESYESLPVLGDTWVGDAPADFLLAHGTPEKIFPQQGCWQLRRYAKTLRFECTSCHAPKASGLVASDRQSG